MGPAPAKARPAASATEESTQSGSGSDIERLAKKIAGYRYSSIWAARSNQTFLRLLANEIAVMAVSGRSVPPSDVAAVHRALSRCETRMSEVVNALSASWEGLAAGIAWLAVWPFEESATMNIVGNVITALLFAWLAAYRISPLKQWKALEPSIQEVREVLAYTKSHAPDEKV